MTVFKVSFVLVLVFVVYVSTSSIFVTDDKYNEPTPCEKDDDCSEFGHDSKCVDGFCMCNSSKVCEDRSSILAMKIGENCIHENDCNMDNAQCDNKTCICKPEYVQTPNGTTCLRISDGIGRSCEDSVQCYTKFQFSGCQNNKCACQQHTHAYNGSCYRNVELDQNCSSDGECALVPFSKCISSTCKCMEKYVASSRGSRCLSVSKGFGSHCVDNAQCTVILGSGSECLKGICDCKEMHQFNNKTNKCVTDILLGEICETHSDCHEPLRGESRLECILGECKCKSFYTEVEGYCISSSQILNHSLVIIIIPAVFLYTVL